MPQVFSFGWIFMGCSLIILMVLYSCCVWWWFCPSTENLVSSVKSGVGGEEIGSGELVISRMY